MESSKARSWPVTFVKEKETKNTVRFAEVGDPSTHWIGALYVKKPALAEMGNPERLTIEITVTS